MANNKVGFIYYNVDTDRYQDIRIKKLKKDFGCCGIAVYDYILCEIYRVKGCFIEWDESTAFDVADYFGLKESLVAEIVAYCCSVGLFDKGVHAREKVLTSKSIQSRFTDWSKKAKRSSVIIPEKIMILLEQSSNIPEEYDDSSISLPQSKEKESKETKRKGSLRSAISGEMAARRTELKKQYSSLVDSLADKSNTEVWTAIKSFMISEKPDFIEPYVEVWNIFAESLKLSAVKDITHFRRQKFSSRYSESSFDFFAILKGIKDDKWYQGEGSTGWKVTFDYIFKSQDNYIKILEKNNQ